MCQHVRERRARSMQNNRGNRRQMLLALRVPNNSWNFHSSLPTKNKSIPRVRRRSIQSKSSTITIEITTTASTSAAISIKNHYEQSARSIGEAKTSHSSAKDSRALCKPWGSPGKQFCRGSNRCNSSHSRFLQLDRFSDELSWCNAHDQYGAKAIVLEKTRTPEGLQSWTGCRYEYRKTSYRPQQSWLQDRFYTTTWPSGRSTKATRTSRKNTLLSGTFQTSLEVPTHIVIQRKCRN